MKVAEIFGKAVIFGDEDIVKRQYDFETVRENFIAEKASRKAAISFST